MNDAQSNGGGPSDLVMTAVEEELVANACATGVVDLKRKPVRGQVLRLLVLEMLPGRALPPAGLRLQNAIVQGGLDLEGCTLTKPLLFWHSRIEGGGDRGALILRDARLKRLGIHSSTVSGSIIADRAQFESGLFLGGGLIRGHLAIRGGEVTGALALEGTEVGDGRFALLGNGVRVSGPLIIRRARLKGEVAIARCRLGSGIYAEEASLERDGDATTPLLNIESARIGGDVLADRLVARGGVRLSSTEIAGRLQAAGLRIDAPGHGLAAGGMTVRQGVNLDRAAILGGLWLDGAEIGRQLRAEAVEIDGGETAIGAEVIKIAGSWTMPQARLVGKLSCPGASIEGQLRLTEMRLYGSDIAIRADGSRIRGGCFMARALIVGLVRLPAVELGNQLRLSGATLKVDQGPALLLSGSTCQRDVELNRGFNTIGGVVLDQIRVRGVCDLNGSHIKSALIARGGLEPRSPDGKAISVTGDDLAISLIDAEIDRLQMPERADERPRGIVDLSRAHVGSYQDSSAAWPLPPGERFHAADKRDVDHLVLDGFVYDHLTNPSGAAKGAPHSHREDRVAERRAQWLAGQRAMDLREHFKPQAWVQLAGRLGAQGYHEDARMIEIARRRGERRSHSSTNAARAQSMILDWFALYGHNPWRTLVWMAVFVMLFAGLWSWAARDCDSAGCFDERVFVVSNRDAYTPERFSQRYPSFHPLAYSFDLFVPFVGFGYEDHWRPNLNYGPIMDIPIPAFLDHHTGQDPRAAPADGVSALTVTIGGILYVMGVIETLLGLVLTSLAITGFTGILRDSGS